MRLHSPNMIFLSETKNRDRTAQRVQRQLDMAHAITVEPMGLSGGLALFRNDNIQGIIQERLDRVLVSPNWKTKFEEANVTHLDTEASDHSLLTFSSHAEQIKNKRRFYFDKRWIDCEEVQNIVPEAWVLKKELSQAYKKEEIFWKQKSRALWLLDGDKNTSYFHMATLQRRRRNIIRGFQTSEGRWVSDQTEIVQEVEAYYDTLFSTSNPTNFESVLNHVNVTISDSINQKLIKDISEEEVKNVVFAMHPLKAPGVDG
ncbi:uncharacterized protein LOC142172682 [Nicotiana tabacum]|uniref:Uncharacterized protein LOC142172682 n=1 Tax=Nicotiana tabacum TaxID=4097 RepID=A0AC58T5F1_TOBAC